METQEIALRPFRPQDQAAVRALVLAGLGDHWGWIDETINPDLDDIAGVYVAAGAAVVVAWLGDEVVGAGTLVAEGADAGRLVRMSVSRDHRGRGIGRTLVRHLLDEARARGYRRVHVETTETWADAIGLYRACGFQIEGYRDGDVHMLLELDQERTAG